MTLTSTGTSESVTVDNQRRNVADLAACRKLCEEDFEDCVALDYDEREAVKVCNLYHALPSVDQQQETVGVTHVRLECKGKND